MKVFGWRKAAEHNHAEEDSDKHQTEEKEIGEAPEEEADKWIHQSWGVRIKKEIISESLGKQRDGGNKHNETGTIADPIKITDKDGAEGLEKEQGKNDWSITPKLGNRTESPVSSSTSSKRRLQGDKPSKRSKKYYKDIWEFAKLFQAKNREDIEKKVILGSTGRETEEHTSEIGKKNT